MPIAHHSSYDYLTAGYGDQRLQLKVLFIVAATTLMINYSELRCIRESASTEDYTLNKLLILPVEVNRRKVRT